MVGRVATSAFASVREIRRSLDMLELPTNSFIATSGIKNVLLGKSPERDREIDDICQMIRNAAQGRHPVAEVQPDDPRRRPHRADAGPRRREYSTFVYDKAKQDPPLTEAGPVERGSYWERITYFLERVVPVAEEYKVRIACHPHDPGMPPDKASAASHRVLGTSTG